MKKYLSFMMAIVLVCAMVSCSEAINEDLSVANPEIKTEKFIWEHQLDYVMEHNTVVETPLKLLGYKHIGTITNEGDIDSYLMSIYSDDAYIAVSAPLSEQKYEIFQYRDIINGERDFDATTIFQKQQAQLRGIITIGATHIVELSWQYKNDKFTTLALVTNGDDGVIYDNITTYAISPRADAEQPTWQKYQKSNSNNKNQRQATRVMENDSIAYSYYSLPGHHPDKNIFGKYLWEFYIECISRFRKSDGVYCGTESMYATHNAYSPWYCDARVETVSGIPYATTHHTFAWAYAAGTSPISLSFHGTGFTLPGGETGAQGQEVHTIDTCSSAGM